MDKDGRIKNEGPLSAEALAREEWRGGATFLAEEDAPGHTIPESERDKARMKLGQAKGAGGQGTILPPD